MAGTKQSAIIIAILAAIVIAFFGDVLLGDRALLTSNTCRWLPWADYASPEELDGETYRTDAVRTYLPRRIQTKRSIAAGDFPLWNPYILGGCPFFADPQTAVLYPTTLAFLAADQAKAMGYDVALHFFLAALGMFLFLGAIDANLPGRTLGALAYGFSSFFFLRMGHPTFVAGAAWLPYLFFAYERSRHSVRSGVLLLVVFLCLAYLAGMPQVLLFGVSALLFYAVIDAIETLIRGGGGGIRRIVRVLGPAAAIALLAVGVQLVPFVEYMQNSRGLGFTFEAMSRDHLWQPVFLLRSIVPDFFGNAVDGTSWVGLVKGLVHPYNSGFMVYCGVAGLGLALASLVFLRRSGHIRALLGLLLLSVAAATSASVLSIIYAVFPPASYSQIDRVSVVTCFALAALAGKGISLAGDSDDARERRGFIAIPAVLAAAVALGLLFFRLVGMDLLSGLSSKAQSLAGEAWFESSGFRLLGWLHEGVGRWFDYEMVHIGHALLFACLCAAMVWFYVGLRKRSGIRTAAAWILVAGLLLDLGLTARRYYVSQPRGCLAETEGIRLLESAVGTGSGWRIGGTGSTDRVFPPNTPQIFGIPTFGGLNAMYPSGYVERLRLALAPSQVDDRTAPAISAVGDLMCVRFLTTDRPQAELALSPVMEAMARSRDLVERLAIVDVGGDGRLSLLQRPGEACSLYVSIPQCRYLDFSLGLRGAGCGAAAAPGAEIVLRARGMEAVLLRSGPLLNADSTWSDFRLDVSDLAGRSVAIVLRTTGIGRSGCEIGWSGFDFVLEDCMITMTGREYRIGIGGAGDALAIRLRGSAGEQPVWIDPTGTAGRYEPRFVRFAGRAGRSMITIKPAVPGGAVLIRPGEGIGLIDARLISTAENAPLALRPFYDGDMFIYENQAALPRGICVPRSLFGGSNAPGVGPGRLEIAGIVEELGSRISGKTSLRIHETGRVVADVSVEEECVMLLQDTWYPGWRARVDGVETTVLLTDLGIMGVPVERGEHEVIVEYKPRSVRVGLGLSLAGILLGVLYGAKTKRR